MDRKKLRDFIEAQLGPEPPDRELVEWADELSAISAGLMAVVSDDRVRRRALADRDAQTKECIHKLTEALDAVQHGDLGFVPIRPQ
jgi:hypothetical protein